MNITSVSLSYIFFVVSIIEFIFFLYYKFLVINTGAKSKRRENIIGTMKDPEHWRKRNNIIAFISLFWSLISIFAFIYLKFFYATHLLSIVYVFIYIAAIVLSVFVFIKKNKIVTKK
ncbi:hypothetical protein [Clostridium estertheticum]|uniref:DUF3784 domain-containing protein n=1 Tax=Clostridium estertheticum subsp. estertheticum TaxID=1552 RepID=A0A1J0GJA3_9CLOT|nr:hypothetical protein [Clostridium estertheticum]APC41437.1 hypothetical protein A7L45_15810 [Clostridium estertheticum subsp. estertheticum]MBZ9616662.1 hypothetical protein [Clostridium estertheticum subsp. laramiense]WAG72380.1 hypothetical protein LL032_14560 [Clostridium estertheticum]